MRIALTDGSGQWFSEDKAECFEQDTYWNGNNWVSKATGKQNYHETLYLTKGGKFILKEYNDYSGSVNQYTIIDKDAAAVWFSINEFDPHPKCEKEFNQLEIV